VGESNSEDKKDIARMKQSFIDTTFLPFYVYLHWRCWASIMLYAPHSISNQACYSLIAPLFYFIFYTKFIGMKTHRTQNVPVGVFPNHYSSRRRYLKQNS